MFPCVLIPAYRPDAKMNELIQELLQTGFTRIVVVDDGSGAAFAPLFEKAEESGCAVLRHAVNLGKGRALKTGINYCLSQGVSECGVVTADADGQHSAADILKIARAMAENPDMLVLGIRDFKGRVPMKNRLGNAITQKVFFLINGGNIRDTQTGLRGLPHRYLTLFLSLAGERYEYEMNMLLWARPNAIGIFQVPIETIYVAGNRSSHFNPLLDSARIYGLIFKFAFSSIFAAVIDYLLYAVISVVYPNQLIVSVAGARVVSSLVNYTVNRNFVFRQKNGKASMLKYYILAACIMFSSYGLITFFMWALLINRYWAKLISDILLYFVSFVAQRELIFKARAA